MATYQSVLNNTWDDPVFQAWSSTAKLVFLNLITSHRQNPIGLYAVTPGTLIFETGLPKELFEGAWSELTKRQDDGYARVRFDVSRGVVWIVNTLKHQRGVVPSNRLVAMHIRELLRQHNGCVLMPELIKHYTKRGFGWLFECKGLTRGFKGAMKGPYRIGKDRIGKDRIGKERSKSSTKDKGGVGGFDGWWEAYPNKVGKLDARKTWGRLAPNAELAEKIMGALSEQKRWPQWVRDGGQFIPHPATWLRGRRWEDQPPSEAAMVAAGIRPQSVAEALNPEERERLRRLAAKAVR